MRRSAPSMLLPAALIFFACVNASCGGWRSGVRVHLVEPFPDKLSSWGLFEGRGAPLKPSPGVIPYDLNTPLFSDYADKYRFVWMPEGQSASYSDEEEFDFPFGTILSKTFAFPADGREQLIETRLLVRVSAGWVALPYIWNKSQTEAHLVVAGGVQDVSFKDPSGAVQKIRYSIPNVNECAQCHERSKALLPIGPKARHLNRDFDYADGSENQLARWTRIGYLRGAPAPALAPRLAVWDDAKSATVEARARAYLDANCAHCHQSGGSAGYTGFLLDWKETDRRRLGYCKNPNSAGYSGNLAYDVVPGRPEESILLYRMLSTRPKEMMPEIGRSLVHSEGAMLVREWLASLEGRCE